MIFELLDDFADVISALPAAHRHRQLIKTLQAALTQECANLQSSTVLMGSMSFSALFFQQVRNRVYVNTRGTVDLTSAWTTSRQRGPTLQHRRPVDPSQFVRSWDADPGTDTLRFRGKIKFSPDGEKLLVAALRPIIRVFHVVTGRELEAFNCHGRAVTFDYSADGRFIVVGGDRGPGTQTGFLEVFDILTGELRAWCETRLLVHALIVTAADTVVVCSGPFLCSYSLSLKPLDEIQPYDGAIVNAIARTSDHKLFATGEYHDEKQSAKISVRNAESFTILAEFEGPRYGITTLAFSGDDRLLASGSSHLDCGVVVWNWMAPGTEWDTLLLSHATPRRTREILLNNERVRMEGRVVSTLTTSDSASWVVFYPHGTWMAAAEGSPNLSHDTINIFNGLNAQPDDVCRLSGHASIPVSLDVDPTGQWLASLHASARVVLWSAEAVKKSRRSRPSQQLVDHSVDADCKLILSRCPDDHGFLVLTDTDTGLNIFAEYDIPSLCGVIAPDARYIAVFYWSSLPMNPIIGGDYEQDAPSKSWSRQFRTDTSVRLTLHELDSLRIRVQRSSGLPPGYSMLDDLTNDSGMACLDLRPGLSPVSLLLGPDGSWGAALLKDQDGLFWLLRFDVNAKTSHVEKLDWAMYAAAIFTSQSGTRLGIAIVREEILLRIVDAKQATLRIIAELSGIGERNGLSHGPLLLNGDRILVIRNHQAIRLLSPASGNRSVKEDWPVFNLVDTGSCFHDSAVRDAAVSYDEQHLVLLDSKPSLSVRRLADLTLISRRILDREYARVKISHDGTRVLTVGSERGDEGVSYSLSELV